MKRYPVATYFFVTYLISWTAVALLHLLARRAGLADFGELMHAAETEFTLRALGPQLLLPVPLVFLLTRIVDFGPTLAGLLTPFLIGRPQEAREILQRLLDVGRSGRWLLLALVVPLLIVSAALGLHLLFGGTAGPLQWQGASTVGQLLFWVVLMRTLLGGGLGEELGWRGFALPRLVDQRGLLGASLILGLVWTFWHLPGHLTNDNPLVNLIVQLLYTVPLTFVFTWLYFKSGQTLLPVVLFHGALNGFNAFFEQTLFPALVDQDGFVIFFILVTLILGIAAAWRMRRWQTPSPLTTPTHLPHAALD